MRSSRPVGPASGGAVAVGIALLFGSGAFGFYMLSTIVGAGHLPSHTPNWIQDEWEGDGPLPPVPALPPIPANENAEPGGMDPFELLPDVFVPPAAVMGVMPGN